jgi:hypothetical protein
VYDAYLASFLGYNIATFIAPKIPERYRMGAVVGLVTLAGTAVEMGWVNGREPDPWDIPAVLVGCAAYIGMHALSKRIMARPRYQRREISHERR